MEPEKTSPIPPDGEVFGVMGTYMPPVSYMFGTC